jgi:hypothetical protein
MNNKFKDFARQALSYVVIGLVCLVYLCTAFLTIEKTGKSVYRILADGAIVFLLGFFIDQLFSIQGLMTGETDQRFINTANLHAETVVKISPNIDKLDEWCREKNAENLREQRTRILAAEGLKYSDYFNEDGSAKEFAVDKGKLSSRVCRRFELRRIKCYEKALRLRLSTISAGELTSEGNKSDDPYYLGRTKGDYSRQMNLSEVVSKIGTALIFGYYGVELITDFSYANLIWTALQVVTFLLMGVARKYHASMFITGEFRGRLVKKINFLEMFDNHMKKINERSSNPVAADTDGEISEDASNITEVNQNVILQSQ